LRRHNLGVVFQLIAGSPEPLSRAELAARATLTRATATALVDQLVRAGIVEEMDQRVSGRAGRPAIPVRAARGTMVGLGLEVNVDYLGARAIDLAGEVIAERIEPDDFSGRAPEDVLGELARVCRTVRAAATRRHARVLGAALAVPGPVDRPLGPLRLAPNLGWVDVDVATPLGRALRVPLFKVDNEASLAARAELAARDSSTASALAKGFIYVSGGIGIGAGIVEPGGVYGGAHGWAGEIGHVAVYPNGRVCRCGSKGCLEQYAGRRAIAAGAGLGADTAAAAIAQRAGDGHPPTLAALHRAGVALGIALAGAVNLMDIPAVVLGADLALLAPYVSDDVAAQLRQRVLALHWSGRSEAVLPAVAPALPAMTGAALIVTDSVVSDPAAYL
jgi:predicted NBD/HSP70 family sugar kinase